MHWKKNHILIAFFFFFILNILALILYSKTSSLKYFVEEVTISMQQLVAVDQER